MSETGSDCYPVLGGHRRGINGIKSRDEPDNTRSKRATVFTRLSPVCAEEYQPYTYTSTKMAQKQATRTNQAITLKGSTAMVSEFFEYSVNNILYQRGVYPSDDFR